MNLKKLALASIIVLMAGCDEKELDQTLIEQLWNKTTEVTGIDRKTPKPDIMMMDEDIYLEILKMDCESVPETKKADCLSSRKEMEDSVYGKTGRAHGFLYAKYIIADRNILREDCGKYSDKNKRKQCEADKLSGKNGMILGRAFLADNYVEIYYRKIRDILDKFSRYYASHGSPLDYGESNCYFYSIIAHEMLHIALTAKGVGSNDQHREMRDKHMDPLLNLISDYNKTDRKGYHREMAFSSLEAGINGDEAKKRIKERQKSCGSETKNDCLILPCGLALY